jgi:uncharacterized protein YbjT (DUF2867 family)
MAAAPSTGVNTLTGEGLKEALHQADVVVDVSNSPSFADDEVMQFFTTSTKNLIESEKTNGVSHHVILSIVGADGLPHSGYMKAKVAQEDMVKASGIPFTIVRATQFFEFIATIADAATIDGKVHVPPALFQPIAAADVAHIVSKTASGPAANQTFDIAGPDDFLFEDIMRRYLEARNDGRTAVLDAKAGYFGTSLEERSLVPTGSATTLGEVRFQDWLGRK